MITNRDDYESSLRKFRKIQSNYLLPDYFDGLIVLFFTSVAVTIVIIIIMKDAQPGASSMREIVQIVTPIAPTAVILA